MIIKVEFNNVVIVNNNYYYSLKSRSIVAEYLQGQEDLKLIGLLLRILSGFVWPVRCDVICIILYNNFVQCSSIMAFELLCIRVTGCHMVSL